MVEPAFPVVTNVDSETSEKSDNDAMRALGSATIWLGPRCPDPGDRAAGYGMDGTIVTVHSVQPLSNDRIWRVTLAGEACGRLVRSEQRRRSGWWSLLQIDDLTDAQLALLDAALTDGLLA